MEHHRVYSVFFQNVFAMDVRHFQRENTGRKGGTNLCNL